MAGWIILHRKIFDNFLYTERPFCRLAAFVDLILCCNHDDNEIMFDGEVLEVKRGSFVTSVRKLCDRWGWSNTKVTRYLSTLKKKRMITSTSDKKKTVITLVNYDEYQIRKDTETTPKRQRNDTETSQERQRNDTEASLKHTNKESNNENNEEEGNIYGDVRDRVYMFATEHRIRNMILHQKSVYLYLSKLTEAEVMQAIERSQGKDAAYLLNVLETKTKEKNEPPKRERKPTQRKPRMVMHEQTVSTMTEGELEELRRMAELLDRGRK